MIYSLKRVGLRCLGASGGVRVEVRDRGTGKKEKSEDGGYRFRLQNVK